MMQMHETYRSAYDIQNIVDIYVSMLCICGLDKKKSVQDSRYIHKKFG